MSFRLLINGDLIETSTSINVFNPATGQVLETCAKATIEHADHAVDAADKAFPGWSSAGYEYRSKCLHAAADAVESRRSDFSRLLTQEQGKPLHQALQEVDGAVASLRYYAGMSLPLKKMHDSDTALIYEQRSPLGVVVAITPWNFPLLLLMMKLAPALIAGNTVIAKPSPQTPLTTALLGEVIGQIFPKGVVNVLLDENDLGPYLTSHPKVAKISFTGSTQTGRRVMISAAGTLKRLTLELGGNDAAIVLDDADINQIAPSLFWASMFNSGQVCLATKRIYVHESLYDKACELLANLCDEAVVGNGLDAGVQIGPVQNKAQFEKLRDLIEDCRQHGHVIAGGQAVGNEGYFIKPTLVTGLGSQSRLVCEEQFGPIIPIISFRDVDDAIRQVNNSDYGLGGCVWTSSIERGLEVAIRIETGTVWVNKYLDMPLDISFGGTKQSGIGKEQGLDGLLEYTKSKNINISKF